MKTTVNQNSDDADHDVPQTASDIARRALINQCVIAAGHGVPKSRLRNWLKQEGLWLHASPKEKGFLNIAKSSQRDIFSATWRAEAQVALLWSINKLKSLGTLAETCESGPLVDAIPDLGESTERFIATAKLRPRKKINQEYEVIYDAHCRLRDARRRGVEPPEAINADVIQERHYAFNWIMGYCGQSWDDITTDT